MVFSTYLYVFSRNARNDGLVLQRQKSNNQGPSAFFPCEVMSIPGEAVDADLTVLKRFFSDDAWNKLLMLCKRISFNLTYFLLSNLETVKA